MHLYIRFLTVLFFVAFLVMPSDSFSHGDDESHLDSAWYPSIPFQQQEMEYGQSVITGLDVELLRTVAKRVGYEVLLEQKSWKQQLTDLKTGKQDVAMGALKTEQRMQDYYYSLPYRQETNVLIMRKDSTITLDAKDAKSLIKAMKMKDFRLGVIDGYLYTDDAINAFVDDPTNKPLITRADNDLENFHALVNGEIDGFFVDQIVASTIAWKEGLQDIVIEHPVSFTKDLHFIFSKLAVPEYMVKNFNDAISELKEQGTFSQVVKEYMFPVLLSQTLDKHWFLIIDLIGTIAFGLSGLFLAYKHKYDIVGAFVLSTLPVAGGGIIRDLITSRDEVAFLANPIYITVILIMVSLGYIAIHLTALSKPFMDKTKIFYSHRLRKFVNDSIQIFDALGLAAFTVTGVVVTLGTKSEPLWLWGPVLAMVTGSFGGLLRDVVRSDPEIPMLKGELYPEIAFVWGGFLSFFLVWQSQKIDPDAILTGILITMVGVFVTRMVAVYFNLKSLSFYIKPQE